jgi:hypothetical protein
LTVEKNWLEIANFSGYTLSPEVISWCEENIKGKYLEIMRLTSQTFNLETFKYDLSYEPTILFEDDISLVHFKLRWCANRE